MKARSEFLRYIRIDGLTDMAKIIGEFLPNFVANTPKKARQHLSIYDRRVRKALTAKFYDSIHNI
jgi:hypothetical protein